MLTNMEVFSLNIISPDASKVFNDVRHFSARSPLGAFTVLANHERFVFRILSGNAVLMFESGAFTTIFISDSTLLVSGNKYTITTEHWVEM